VFIELVNMDMIVSDERSWWGEEQKSVVNSIAQHLDASLIDAPVARKCHGISLALRPKIATRSRKSSYQVLKKEGWGLHLTKKS
jgi:hypothetical protein